MNPMEMIKNFMTKNMNPKEIVMNMASNYTNNPMINNLIQMAEKNDTKGIEQFARNFCNERNTNYDNEFSKFMSNFKK